MWKAQQVTEIPNRHSVRANSLCKAGCGARGILRCLRTVLPSTRFVGYDVSPQVSAFWEDDVWGIKFVLGDFYEMNKDHSNVIFMLDVIEHLRGPMAFPERTRAHGDWFVFRLPLDLSAVSGARKNPLLRARQSAGHLHSYTKDLALETLTECGVSIVE